MLNFHAFLFLGRIVNLPWVFEYTIPYPQWCWAWLQRLKIISRLAVSYALYFTWIWIFKISKTTTRAFVEIVFKVAVKASGPICLFQFPQQLLFRRSNPIWIGKKPSSKTIYIKRIYKDCLKQWTLDEHLRSCNTKGYHKSTFGQYWWWTHHKDSTFR